jgi:uncharacterized protein
MSTSLRMTLRPETLAVARLTPQETIPEWATRGALWSIVRSEDELSIVCGDEQAPESARAERGWRALQLAGPIPFGLTGILASVLTPLAAAGIGIFAFSTFDTDYVLVKTADLDPALTALRQAGHVIL